MRYHDKIRHSIENELETNIFHFYSCSVILVLTLLGQVRQTRPEILNYPDLKPDTLSKYQTLIDDFRGRVLSKDFENNFLSAAARIPKTERFLLKMELKTYTHK